MDHRTDYDLIIIGTGAGGGTLLHALAGTGKKILVLERGGYLPREKQNWDSGAVFLDNRYKAKESWSDRDGAPLRPEIHYYVGGNTKLYGSALLRFRKEDFEELRHVDGVSPAWPVGYDEFEPHYAEAERIYRIHGLRGTDPTEPPFSSEYPDPPLRHEPRVQLLHDDLVKLGHRPFPLPVGLLLDEEDAANSPCIRCDTCDGYPCLMHAKADTETVCVRPALSHPNVTLLTHAFAERLLTDPTGREVTGVVVRRDESVETYRADVVVVACGAINSAALLLRSASDASPNGVANGNGVVGRYYMCHNNSPFVAISPRVNETAFQKTLGLNDFYFGSDRYDHPLGHVQTMGKADAEKFRAASPVWLPRVVLDALARHSLDFWVTSEDLPNPENRVRLGPDGAIRLDYRPNNLKAHDRLIEELKRLLWRIDRHHWKVPLTLSLRKKVPLSGTTHQCGTLRFGTDPASSVLDPNCRAHEVDNLYVVDGSFFPSSAALNPALTIFANALRVAAHLKERLGG